MTVTGSDGAYSTVMNDLKHNQLVGLVLKVSYEMICLINKNNKSRTDN